MYHFWTDNFLIFGSLTKSPVWKAIELVLVKISEIAFSRNKRKITVQRIYIDQKREENSIARILRKKNELM